ncbi:MAG: 1-acyl-sn-glycerol-3-phosphate acyltransferase [Nostocoides sp.]
MKGIPPPPLIIRRAMHVVWPFVGLAVSYLALPFVVAGCVQALVTRSARLLRMTGLVVLLVWVDIRLLLGGWRLWFASPRKDSPTWVEDHERLLVASLDEALALARRWVGFDVVLDEPMWFGRDDAPLIAFARHAGPADSLAIAWLLARTADRLPRIVLAEALRWDPGLDTILSRLHSYFVPASSARGEDRARGIGALAHSLQTHDVLLIFPEGENWSPNRRRHLITRLRSRGEAARARRAEQLRNVLPPRTGGAVAALTARPDADVMIVAHAGFGRLTSPKDIYAAIPFRDRPFLVRTWTYAADQVPTDPDGITNWIEHCWTEVDAWVTAHEGP